MAVCLSFVGSILSCLERGHSVLECAVVVFSYLRLNYLHAKG